MGFLEKHPVWLRWVHWLNVPFLFIMIWSGTLIYWANAVYPGFFPDWFYSTFRIDHRLAEGMAIHFTFGWLFFINGTLYFLYLAFSGHWRKVVPDRRAMKDLVPTILHDLGFKTRAPSFELYNAAQRVAYTSVWFLGVLEVMTGLAIYKPTQLRWLTAMFGGYEAARAIHFSIMVLFVAFVFIHVIQVIRAGWNNFRSMVAGFELRDAQEENENES